MDRELILANGLADGIAATVKREIAKAQLVVPAPLVTNDVHPAKVEVQSADLGPIADSLKELAVALTKQGELLGRLIQVLSAQPSPTFNVPQANVSPVFQVPEVKVIHSSIPPAKPREKRMYTIVHADGEKSTVMEE